MTDIALTPITGVCQPTRPPITGAEITVIVVRSTQTSHVNAVCVPTRPSLSGLDFIVTPMLLTEDPSPKGYCRKLMEAPFSAGERFVDRYLKEEYTTRDVCFPSNRPLSQRLAETLVSVDAPPVQEPDFTADIKTVFPSRSGRVLGRIYFIQDPISVDHMVMYRIHSDTTRRFKRGMSLTEVRAAANKISLNAPIPYLSTYAAMLQYTNIIDTNAFIMVGDSSADPDGSSGQALYVYRHDTNVLKNLAQLDFIGGAPFSSIVGRPIASASTIDEMVTKAHQHNFPIELDMLKDRGGHLVYGDTTLTKPVKWAATAW